MGSSLGWQTAFEVSIKTCADCVSAIIVWSRLHCSLSSTTMLFVDSLNCGATRLPLSTSVVCDSRKAEAKHRSAMTRSYGRRQRWLRSRSRSLRPRWSFVWWLPNVPSHLVKRWVHCSWRLPPTTVGLATCCHETRCHASHAPPRATPSDATDYDFETRLQHCDCRPHAPLVSTSRRQRHRLRHPRSPPRSRRSTTNVSGSTRACGMQQRTH